MTLECAYLCLADDQYLLEAAKNALDRYGNGMASVRLIGGTQKEHKQLEALTSSPLKMQDPVFYSTRIDANAGEDGTRRGRHHLDSAEPCLDNRRCPAVRDRRFRHGNNTLARRKRK
ncbi:hypothetical protein [Mesorhizobium sp. LSJC285A00]|uniref:hypothetical protein n=1 Tax=Mesorhizobium sp. LSJC285A00 TaxID=1287338 RepID=UPI0004196A3A|nr:hypothetical protein [Mesorhizobium sp. LSJC285A00]